MKDQNLTLARSDAATHISSPAFGEVGALLGRRDWSNTSLGPPSAWPKSLRTIIETMLPSRHGMMLAWGPDLALVYNDAYAPFLGLRHPWALGRPFHEVWSDIWTDIAPLVDKAMGGEAVWLQDFHLAMERNGYKEDTWWQFSYSPVRDDNGSIAGLLNVVSEMTGKVLAEHKLRALNAELEQRVIERTHQRGKLWQISSDMLSVIDIASGMIDAVNPAWTTTLGWAPDDVEGHPYTEFVHPDDIHASAAAFEQVRAGHPVMRFENRYRTETGDWRWLSWVALPEDGKLYSTIRDMTDEKRRQAELEATQEALRQSQKMEAMGQLTGGVAHDFNNLLTPIIGALDLLIRRGIGSDRERRLIDGALQSAERARILVQRLLAFARRQPLQPMPVDIRAVVDGMAGLIDATLGPRIDVQVIIAGNLPPAIADPNQLEMALLNLAVNARDAMPDGGALKIAATRESVRSGHDTKLRQGHYVCLSVTDTGCGMDEATRTRAIEPFFSTKGIGKGTGLGLSMVHGLVAQLGGKLLIDSAPGRGTKIALWLPVSLAPAVIETTPAITPKMTKTRGTALLVDDEELVRITTADMLEDLGFEIIEAKSAEEASRLIEQGAKLDVVITDHLMPGMTGADLVLWLRLHRPDLPVLLVSGYADAAGLPADVARLNKPFRNLDLAASLFALMPAAAQ